MTGRLKEQMSKPKEYVDPFDKDDPDFWIKIEHLGRYVFACDVLRTLSQKRTIVVDAGCGCGYGCQEISSCCHMTVGLDRNTIAIDYAKKHYQADNISYFVHDIEDDSAEKLLEAGINKTDMVIAFEVLEHLDEPEKGVKQLYDILRPGGLFVCSVPNSKFEAVSENGKPKNEYHKHVFTKELLSELLTKHGLVIEEIYGQSTTNILMKREAKLAGKGLLNSRSNNTPWFHNPETTRYFTHMFAIPDKAQIEDSYSFIAVAKKREAS
jgi:2-polyprenyl-3-methyl-5-hydroxy-6-metoxy-1,4-benzoquinol methylase